MAIVETPGGDLVATVRLTETLMDPARLAFVVALSHPLVQAGYLDEWQPLRVRVRDQGSADAAVVGAWVTHLSSDGSALAVEARDAAVWLERRTLKRPTDVAKGAGEHAADLVGRMFELVETRAFAGASCPGGGNAATGGGSRVGLSVAGVDDVFAWFWASSAGWDVTKRQAVSTGLQALGPLSPQTIRKVEVGIGSSAAAGAMWSNTVAVSADGATWGTEHAAPAHAQWGTDWIDVTADLTWDATLLAAGVAVRLTSLASRDSSYVWETVVVSPTQTISVMHPTLGWMVGSVFLRLTLEEGVVGDFPLLPGTIQAGGPALTLAANERRTLRAWLDDLVKQSGWEWRIRDNPAQLGGGLLDFGERVGGDAYPNDEQGSGIVGGLDEGSRLLPGPVAAELDALARYTRVRVTAESLVDQMAEDKPAQAVIGVHELVEDLGANHTAAEQTAEASARIQSSALAQLTFSLVLPRRAGVWSAIQLGDTVLCRIEHAPVDAWQGTVRLLGREIDEGAGTLTAAVAAISTDLASRVKETPPQGRKRRLQEALELARRARR